MVRITVLAILMGAMSLNVYAASIRVEVLDGSTLKFSFAGQLVGPTPTNAPGHLWIDTPGTTPPSSAITMIGGLSVGAVPIESAYTGFQNAPYGSAIQLRSNLNGETAFSIGATLSGMATVVYNAPHGLLQSVFDGPGVPFYWGRNLPGPGPLQGFAQTSPVPLPAAVWLFFAAIGGLICLKKKR